MFKECLLSFTFKTKDGWNTSLTLMDSTEDLATANSKNIRPLSQNVFTREMF